MSASRSLLRGAARLTSISSRRFVGTFNKTPPAENKGIDSEQALPLGAYYEAVLHKPQPIPEVKPEEPPQSSPKAPKSSSKKASSTARKRDSFSAATSANESASAEAAATVDTTPTPRPEPSAPPATAEEKARIVFGSRLAGPAERAERLKALREKSQLIAGVLVPPKPEEPDNCCMSGCVNCVWDRYRDEMEEWATATVEAERRLQAQRAEQPKKKPQRVTRIVSPQPPTGPEAISMDDDGGGSETNWDIKQVQQPKIAKDFWDEELYKNVPVGIREFMKTEKRLKERHLKEGSIGG